MKKAERRAHLRGPRALCLSTFAIKGFFLEAEEGCELKEEKQEKNIENPDLEAWRAGAILGTSQVHLNSLASSCNSCKHP